MNPKDKPSPGLLQALRLSKRPAAKANHHFVIVVLDSCRYDSFVAASPKHLTRLSGKLEKRFSYATWTPPSHFNLLMGLIPHTSPPGTFASEVYKNDFENYNRRLDTQGIEFSSLIPHLWLPTFLQRLGYVTHARVAMPILNPATPLNMDFDSYQLMDKHNDFESMLETLIFPTDRPAFYLLNIGETHFPYALPSEEPDDWPKVHGPQGILVDADHSLRDGGLVSSQDAAPLFQTHRIEEMRRRQIEAVKHVDRVFATFLDIVPQNTWIVVTADHGELFGEEGYFGHGPIQHRLVHEVPFIEGLKNS